MLNAEIATIFERMARVLAFKGQDRFRIMAYERAAVSIRDLEEDLASIAQQGKLEEIPGIGKDLSEMIEEYLRTGKIKRYEQECRGIPAGLVELMSIPGLGPKTLALLHEKFHIRHLEDLNSCLEKAASAKLKGFGQKKIDNMAMESWTIPTIFLPGSMSSSRRFTRGFAIARMRPRAVWPTLLPIRTSTFWRIPPAG